MASAPLDEAAGSRSASAAEVPSASPAELAARPAALRRLEWAIRRRLDGFAAGGFLSTRLGPGTEAAGARLYGPGDDARHIDWKLSARAAQIHLRTTDADR